MLLLLLVQFQNTVIFKFYFMNTRHVCFQITFQTELFRTNITSESLDIKMWLVVYLPLWAVFPLQLFRTFDTTENVADVRVRPAVGDFWRINVRYRCLLVVADNTFVEEFLLMNTYDVRFKITCFINEK